MVSRIFVCIVFRDIVGLFQIPQGILSPRFLSRSCCLFVFFIPQNPRIVFLDRLTNEKAVSFDVTRLRNQAHSVGVCIVAMHGWSSLGKIVFSLTIC